MISTDARTTCGVQEAGSGPTVICLHASLSASSQWRPLTECLSDRFRVVAVDLYGCGRTAPWPGKRALRLEDELALVAPVLARAGERFHLVGHSYGGAVALAVAFAYGERVASLALYEPALLGTLVASQPHAEASHELVQARDDVLRLARAGLLDLATARFVDYWCGGGSWGGMPLPRRQALVAAMPGVLPQFDATWRAPLPAEALAALDMPALMLSGSFSTAAGRALARLVASSVPGMALEELRAVGHMGPITHAAQVNRRLARFLDEAQLRCGAWTRPSASFATACASM